VSCEPKHASVGPTGKLPDAPGLVGSVGLGSVVGPPDDAGSVGLGAALADGPRVTEGDADELAGEAGDGPSRPHAEIKRARITVSASAVPPGNDRRRTEGGIPRRALLTPRD
jgi:hypothetical protein